MKKKLCIIQARMGSTRLPNKVLLEVKRTPLLEYEIQRVKRATLIDRIVVATTDSPADEKIVELCSKIGVDYFRGSEKDVLDRYYQCALKYPEYGTIIRITGDCPLIDPKVIDEVLRLFDEGKYDYASNVAKETFPDGMDIEVFTREALKEAANEANLASEREHVTLYIRNREKFKKGNLEARHDFSHFRLTVDQKEDFEVIQFLIENSSIEDEYLHYISVLTKHPDIMAKNMSIMRNEGLKKSLKEDRVIQ